MEIVINNTIYETILYSKINYINIVCKKHKLSEITQTKNSKRKKHRNLSFTIRKKEQKIKKITLNLRELNFTKKMNFVFPEQILKRKTDKKVCFLPFLSFIL